jgi:hypothetical protein
VGTGASAELSDLANQAHGSTVGPTGFGGGEPVAIRRPRESLPYPAAINPVKTAGATRTFSNIVLTAVTLEKVRRQCLAEGAAYVLNKPFDADDVSKVIGEALRQTLPTDGDGDTLDPSTTGAAHQ